MLCRVTVNGRFVRDPELRFTQNNVAVTSFSLAVDRDYKDKGSDAKKTDFFNFVAWRNTAEFINNYFKKGRSAVVDGRLQNKEWTDKDGKNHVDTEILVEHIYFNDKPRESAKTQSFDQGEGSFSSGQVPDQEMDYDDEELPF